MGENQELLADELELELKKNDMVRISITSQDEKGTYTNLNVEARMEAGVIKFIPESKE